MFAGRLHKEFIELREGETRLYRLPPISNGPIFIHAFDADPTPGPKGTIKNPSGPASDLELELKHSEHLTLKGTNRIFAESLWHDDLWRLRVHRRGDPAAPSEPLRYRIEAQYTSVLPVLERRISARFFHDGFRTNWNDQQYLKIRLIGSTIQILVGKDLAALYGLQPEAADIGSGFVTFKSIDLGPVSFTETVDVTSLKLDVGAGPHPLQGGNALFFSARADGPAVTVKVEVPGPNTTIDVPPFHITLRFYLTGFGGFDNDLLSYVPTVESNLLDQLDRDIPTVGNIKNLVKKAIEDGLDRLQVAPESGSKFGDFLKPWLIGGPQALFSLGYAPGPGDQFRPGGTVEPATGELIVRYVGPRAKPDTTLKTLISTGSSGQTVDDGSVRLFNVPDEEPDPVPGQTGGSGLIGVGLPFGGSRPKIGALAKVDHIVVLMQENRSFDQVLGYRRRDRGDLRVEGLLPPGAPGSEKQQNRFANREFRPSKATKDDPQRSAATAWPSFELSGPGHDSEDVISQMLDGMGGFVSNYARRLGLQNTEDTFLARNLRLVMDYFDATDLREYGVLADEFAICDQWYTAHAGPTWPNRVVLLSGDLSRDRFGTVEVDNADFKTMIPLQQPSLFDLLNERGVSWRVYEHGVGFARMFRNLTFDTTNVLPFDDPVRGFEGAARSGTLPAVTLIEPDYIDLPPGNDDHPPADMANGQQLVNRIVGALVASPGWERTLFVITYDEHGGFYDHVSPPTDAPPLSGSFTRLGPRVPAFIVSPLVERGDVIHDRFDHTSIGATILRRFCGRNVPRVSPRMDAARDLRSVLKRADSPRPRSEFNSLGLPPVAPQRLPAARAASTGGVRIEPPKTRDDFHGLLAAVRLTIGQPPKQTGALRRKPQAVSGELLFYRDKTRNGTGSVADPSVIGLGGWQSFRSVFAGVGGVIYAINAEGQLLRYQDRTLDGTGDVANPAVIGQGGWQSFRHVLSGAPGILYAVDAQGRLLFYRDRSQDGGGDLANPSVIGKGGWQQFRFLVSGGGGTLYAVDAPGRLLFYRDTRQDGTGDVANPAVLSRGGWQHLKFLFSGGDGILYAVDAQGRLLFYRDTKQDGTGEVANPATIGQRGWQKFKFLLGGSGGTLYAVRP